MAAITFTIDLEDPTERYDPDGRYVLMTRRILDLCDATGRKATFFTVGRVAMAVPELMKDIAARGHEIAYHSHAHRPLTRENPERFRRESAEDKDRLEQLAGKKLVGFRAPAFSLMAHTTWVLDILGSLGFTYSSSIMPTHISRYGFPKAPRKPFRWPNGMIELPLPIGKLGSIGVPYLGGIYLYMLPFGLVRHWIKQSERYSLPLAGRAREGGVTLGACVEDRGTGNTKSSFTPPHLTSPARGEEHHLSAPQEILWTYTHPYDFDYEEKFIPNLHGSAFASTILWLARRVAHKKIEKVLSFENGSVLADRVKALTSPGIHS